MSKYDQLWQYIKNNKTGDFQLSFDEVEKAAGLPIDHSFLRYKKELPDYGFEVKKISLKNKTVKFYQLQRQNMAYDFKKRRKTILSFGQEA